MKTSSIILFLTCLFTSEVLYSQCNQSVKNEHYWGSNDGSEATDLMLGLRKIGNGNNATCLESFRIITSYDFNNGTTYFKNRSHAWGSWHMWTKGSANGDLDIAMLGGSLTQNTFTMYDATSNAQKVKFNSNGVSFLNGGKIGIGTTSPDGVLHVIGDPSANDASAFGSGGYIVVGSPTSTNIAIDNNEIMARNNNGISGLLLQSDGGAVTIHGGSAPTSSRVHISGSGNVGIGTLSPANKLDIVDSSPSFRIRADVNNREITIKPGDGNIEMADSVSTLHLNRWSPSPVALAMGGGNVGIGTALPTSKLHVTGGMTLLDGPDNNGATGTLMLRSGADTMILDGNEIDAIGSNNNKLHLNQNVANDVAIAGGGGNVVMTGTGNVGIGTGTPTSKLHVSGQTLLGGPKNDGVSTSTLILKTGTNTMLLDGNEIDATGTGNTTLHLNQNVASDVAIAGGGGNVVMVGGGNVIVDGGGKVGIGTTVIPVDYKLAVNGKIISTEVKVQGVANWPDYVFKNDYSLLHLNELEQSIQQNGHLPGIPSAAEVAKNGGVEVGDMQRRLLEKVEELTLYIIQLEKRMKEMENRK